MKLVPPARGNLKIVENRPQLRQLPVQHAAAGPGLLGHPQLCGLTELADQAAHRLGAIGNDPEVAYLSPQAPPPLPQFPRHGHRGTQIVRSSSPAPIRMQFCAAVLNPIRIVIRELQIGDRSSYDERI